MAKILISKSHLIHNLSLIEEKLQDKNKIAVVLKDNAYGHGIVEIGKICSEFGVKNAVVQSVDEAQQVVTFFDNILILADTTPHSYSHTFHITINCLKDIKTIQKNTKVQLKVDTGMHRNGISINELEEAILGICEQKLVLTGVFTHHRSADEISSVYFWQKMNFNAVKSEVKRICEKLSLPLPLFHSCNSSALFRDNNFSDDMARVGIALYGYLDTDNAFNNPKLKPVMSLFANKIATRKLYKNQCVGYGGSYKAENDMEISTYNVGYGDGFLRLDGNDDYKTPDGFKVLGKVSMDNLSLNSTQDEVCIFNDVTSLAKIHNTITYEILCSLKSHITREVIE
ncbi:MAG: alanine racemase [Candidatus Marinarcus sp.]|uniref:alanine racemase n=1 Tax=Candidatus Marinarcus sp. TaxID=3100987 RepID=UPI003B004477